MCEHHQQRRDSAPVSALPSFRKRALSREYVITAVYDVLEGSGMLFTAYGFRVGRFLGDGEYADLINYRRKNSKHH